MKIEIDDEQFFKLFISKLKQDYIAVTQLVAQHKEHGVDNEDSAFFIESMKSYPQLLRYYMAPREAEAFIIDVARGEYAD